ncbi:hypothetical protein U9M48_037650, partial [Paspalum notatum var. saurae]
HTPTHAHIARPLALPPPPPCTSSLCVPRRRLLVLARRGTGSATRASLWPDLARALSDTARPRPRAAPPPDLPQPSCAPPGRRIRLILARASLRPGLALAPPRRRIHPCPRPLWSPPLPPASSPLGSCARSPLRRPPASRQVLGVVAGELGGAATVSQSQVHLFPLQCNVVREVQNCEDGEEVLLTKDLP